MANIRILLADDHAILRAGVRMLLESQPDMEVVGEAANGEEAVRQACQLRPDVAVVDIVMPEIGGLEAMQRIRDQCPDVHILALTMHEDERYFFQALHAGASGYIAKGAPPEDFVSAVRSVARGQAYVYPALTRKLIDEYLHRSGATPATQSGETLTEREQQVLRLIAEGCTAKEIAQQLGISSHTVDRHRQKLMAKLDLHNRAALVRYAISKGLIEVDNPPDASDTS